MELPRIRRSTAPDTQPRRPVDVPAGGDVSVRHPWLWRSPWLAAAVALALCGTALLVLVEAGWHAVGDTDRAVARRWHRSAVAEPGWTHTHRILTDWVWDPITLRLLTLTVVIVLLLRGARRLALWLAGSSLVGLLLQWGLKAVVARERPRWTDPVDSANGWAFPSGHAMTATVTFGLLLVLVCPLVRGRAGRALLWGTAVCSVLGVGLTRVYLGVHWPSDVLGGWLFGAATVTAAAAVLFAPCSRRPWSSQPRVSWPLGVSRRPGPGGRSAPRPPASTGR